MNWKRIGIVNASILGTIAVVTSAWAAMDYLGVRPVFKNEFAALGAKVEVVAISVQWLQYKNLDNKRKNGGLTPRECAEYRSLAKSLGLVPGAC